MLLSKTNLKYWWKSAKNEIIWLIIMEMRMKMKKRSHKYNINRTWPEHGYEYTKYKICLSVMMVMSNKQHLCNFWSLVYEKVKQHWGWVEKNTSLIKKACVISRHNAWLEDSEAVAHEFL